MTEQWFTPWAGGREQMGAAGWTDGDPRYASGRYVESHNLHLLGRHAKCP